MQLFVRGLESIETLEVSQDATVAGVKVSFVRQTQQQKLPPNLILFNSRTAEPTCPAAWLQHRRVQPELRGCHSGK